ncbi:MAG TPA: sugar ABC transporter substrate-binding protein [Ktedonobacterales bacterium]|nr:sugar ABC transporter substrate-binding protein [Ktedonobacterales bacterium]
MHRFHSLRWRAASATLLGATILGGVLVGCGAGSTTSGANGGKGCMKVGVLLPESDTSARWESKDHPLLDAAIKQALPGVHIDYNNANNNADTQQSQAEADLTKGDCILVLAPQDAQKSATIVADAKKDGVPVIAYDRLVQSNDLAYYVSFDNTKVGDLQGQYIADHYQKYVSSGHSNLVMINGSQTDNNALLFKAGAHQALDPLISNKTLNLVGETFTPDWNNATAQTEMEGYLTKQSNDIQVAYVANDGMAGTVIQALKAQNLAGKVLVTGQDATVQGIQNILLGTQAMTVYKAISKEADATAQLVAALSKGTSTSSIVNGQTKNANGVNIPSVLEVPVAVDSSNIASTVLADGFVTKSDICQGVPAGTDGIC